MPQMNKIVDIYVPLFESTQNALNTEDVMCHLIKLTNKSYNSTIEATEKKSVAQTGPAAGQVVAGQNGAGVIGDRKKAMQAKLKAAIGNSRL